MDENIKNLEKDYTETEYIEEYDPVSKTVKRKKVQKKVTNEEPSQTKKMTNFAGDEV